MHHRFRRIPPDAPIANISLHLHRQRTMSGAVAKSEPHNSAVPLSYLVLHKLEPN